MVGRRERWLLGDDLENRCPVLDVPGLVVPFDLLHVRAIVAGEDPQPSGDDLPAKTVACPVDRMRMVIRVRLTVAHDRDLGDAGLESQHGEGETVGGLLTHILHAAVALSVQFTRHGEVGEDNVPTFALDRLGSVFPSVRGHDFVSCESLLGMFSLLRKIVDYENTHGNLLLV